MGAGSSWRRRGVAGLVAAGALACGVAGGRAYDGGQDGPPPAPSPAPPAGSPFAGAPWLVPEGAPLIDGAAPRRSVRFPAGVGYPEALERLLLAALGGGELPEGTTLEAPLPREVVLVRSRDPSHGLRLSLTAPWGYDEAGRIRDPTVAVPAGWDADRVRGAMALLRGAEPALADGVRVDAPPLAPCQVAEATPDNRPPCPERP